MTRRHQLIERDDIKQLLTSLYSPDGNPTLVRRFAQLAIIRQRIQSLAHLGFGSTELTEYAILDFLHELIEHALKRQRYVLFPHDELPPSPQTHEDACQLIRKDAQSQSMTLIGWSFVYHVHIRQDLNINQQKYAEIGHCSTRTLYRYREQIIDLILLRLIDYELDYKAH